MSDQNSMADLESRVAFQEDAIDKLSDVVARQERDIERLTRMVQILHSQIKEIGDDRPVNDAPPPHY